MLYILYLIYIACIATSVSTSLIILIKKNTPLHLKLFFPFLLTTVIVEIIAHNMAHQNINNLGLYNTFMTLEFAFYFYVFSHMVKNARAKNAILVSLFFYPVFSLLYFAVAGFREFHYYVYGLGTMLVLIFCVIYFYELFKSPVIHKPAREPAFWIGVALFFFYSCTPPLFVGEHLMYEPHLWPYAKMINVAIKFCNCVFYSLFTVAFFYQLRKTGTLE